VNAPGVGAVARLASKSNWCVDLCSQRFRSDGSLAAAMSSMSTTDESRKFRDFFGSANSLLEMITDVS